MNRLLEIGFQYAGNWSLNDEQISYTIKHHEHDKNVLYAFVCNGEVMYIGKTTQRLTKRLSGYQKPSNTQTTNQKNNANILSLLNNGEPVDIFVFVSNGLLKYGDYPINLAAGLEDILIDRINPHWNGSQRKPESPSTASISTGNHSFQLKLGIAYYNQGFINVPVMFTDVLGEDGGKIEIYLGEQEKPVLGYINRTVNNNQTPRVMGGKLLKSWIQKSCQQGQFITVNLMGKYKLQIIPV